MNKISSLTNSEKSDTIVHILSSLLVFSLPLSTSLTNILLILVLPFMALSPEYRRNCWGCYTRPESLVFVGFFVLILLGATYSVAPIEDITHYISKMRKLLYFPLLLPLFIEEKWRKWAINAFLAAMVVNIGVGVLNYYGLFGAEHRYGLGYPFKDRIHTSLLLIFSIFVLFHQFLMNKPLRPLYCLIACLFLYFMFFISSGRTGLIIFVVGLGVALLQIRNLKIVMVACLLIGLFLGASLGSSSPLLQRWVPAIKEIQHHDSRNIKHEYSTYLRMIYTKNSFKIFLHKPFLGHGTGAFKSVYKLHYEDTEKYLSENPHNEYLNIMVQYGLVGLLAIVGLIGFLVYRSFNLPRFEQYLVQGLLSIVAVGCLANSWLMDFPSGYLLVMVAAVCFGAHKRKTLT